MRIFTAALVAAGLQAVPAAAFEPLKTPGDFIVQAYSPPVPFGVGSRVSCNWQGRGRMYSGTVARRLGPSTIRVHYDDGDRETTFISNCRFLGYGGRPGGNPSYGGWNAGSRVACNWQGRGRMYNGVIARRFGPTTIRVHYDDGDRETTSIDMCRLR
ncbi:MAG: hypothetical protein KDJ29_00505 [Hyphomicrobiales bacterium]|nr:hypothetical protein [Hyphomicrobiales bacterium]